MGKRYTQEINGASREASPEQVENFELWKNMPLSEKRNYGANFSEFENARLNDADASRIQTALSTIKNYDSAPMKSESLEQEDVSDEGLISKKPSFGNIDISDVQANIAKDVELSPEENTFAKEKQLMSTGSGTSPKTKLSTLASPEQKSMIADLMGAPSQSPTISPSNMSSQQDMQEEESAPKEEGFNFKEYFKSGDGQANFNRLLGGLSKSNDTLANAFRAYSGVAPVQANSEKEFFEYAQQLENEAAKKREGQKKSKEQERASNALRNLMKAEYNITDDRLDQMGYDDLKASYQILQAKENQNFKREENQAFRDQRSGQQKSLEQQRNVSNMGRYQEAFNKDKIVQNANESLTSAQNIRALLDSNNPLADKAVPTAAAKMSGQVGALTERDVSVFGGSQALKDRLAQSVEEMKTGKFTKTNRDFLRQLSDVFEKRSQEKISERSKYFADQGSKRFNIPKEDAYDYIVPGGQYPSTQSKEKPEQKQNEMVQVQAPNGSIKEIPLSKLNDALQAGGKRVK